MCDSNPTQVKNLRLVASNKNASHLFALWDSVSNAYSYNIQICTGTCTSSTRTSSRTSTNRWKTGLTSNFNLKEITGLLQTTRYSVRVQGVRGRAKGAWSSIASGATKKQCPRISCGIGSIDGSAVDRNVSCSGCPTPPTVEDPTYSVNEQSCAINAIFNYSGGNRYRASISNGYTFPEKAYSGTSEGVSLYTLIKPGDYNKTYSFNLLARRNSDPSGVWSTTTSKQFTTPQVHPKSNFTVEYLEENGQMQLQYTPENVRATLAGLRFSWDFSEDPTFHNGTNSNSINPVVSFATPGMKNITLTVTDANIPGTGNKGCSSSQLVNAGESVTSSSKMRSPTIDSVAYDLSNAPLCTPSAKITYTSPEEQRGDILQLFVGNTQVYTDRENVSQPSTRSFTVPVNPNTEYRAVLTTHDFSTNPTKSPSDSVEQAFTTPNTQSYPTADFSYTLNADATLQLNYTGNANSIRWRFSETPSYIQGSATSKSIVVAFPTNGTKTIRVTASSSSPELNACTYSQSINVQPAAQSPIYPLIREAPAKN